MPEAQSGKLISADGAARPSAGTKLFFESPITRMTRIRRARLSLFIRAIRAIRCFYVLMGSGLASCPLNYLETSFSCYALAAQIRGDQKSA